MGYLILSILSNSFLFVYFRVLDKWKINLISAIVFNYLACILTGMVSSGIKLQGFEISMVLACMLLGFLFFGTFYLMGFSSIHAGVGVTGAATKLSLIIPVLFTTLYRGNNFSPSLLLSLLLAVISILLITGKTDTGNNKNKLMLPLLIFLGSGTIDTLLGELNQFLDNRSMSHETAIIFIFCGALIPGALTMQLTGKLKMLRMGEVIAGLTLGFINFFSVKFMLMAMSRSGLPLNRFFPVNNMGIVLLTFLSGLIIWKENTEWRKWVGVVLSLLSILLIL